MKRSFLLLLALVQFVFTNKLVAQQVQIKTDAKQISVGDQARVFITASFDKSAETLNWPKFPDTFNSLEIVEKGKIDTAVAGNTLTLKQRLLVTGFDSGSFLFPRFPFLHSRAGIADTLFSDSFRIAVSTVPVDTTKPFKAIKGVAEVQTSWRDYIGMIGAFAVGLLVAIVLIVVLLKTRKKRGPVSAKPEETLQERTLRLLSELEEKQLWQNDKAKQYYTELSEIVRRYIELRFNTHAMELTTDELLKKAKKHKEMAAFAKTLKPLLQAADLAKFAKAVPLPEEHIEAMQLARNFVQVSKPKPEVQNPTANNLNQK